MKFSSKIKQELNNINNLNKKREIKYELMGYLLTSNIDEKKQEYIYSTESEFSINRYSRLLLNLDIEHKIDIVGKIFHITVKKVILNKYINFEFDFNTNLNSKDKIDKEKKALVRGMYLGSGSSNNPENNYHLEIALKSMENCENIKILLEKFNINIKLSKTENKNLIYIKDVEEISKFLAFIGANKCVLDLEDTRIQKEMNSKINRIVNCESANMSKTINASIAQIKAIEKIRKKGKFNELDENLKEIADIRIKYPNISLIELGKFLETPIGKSGVNYRLNKIMEIADEI